MEDQGYGGYDFVDPEAASLPLVVMKNPYDPYTPPYDDYYDGSYRDESSLDELLVKYLMEVFGCHSSSLVTLLSSQNVFILVSVKSVQPNCTVFQTKRNILLMFS